MADLTSDVNLQGLWYLEEASGDRLDVSGKGNTLTDTNTVTQSATCKQGTYSAEFVAANSESLIRVSADLSAAFPGKNGTTQYDFTVGAWCQFASHAARHTIMGKDYWTNNPSFLLEFNELGSDHKFTLGMYNGGNWPHIYSNTATTSTGTWYHVVGRFQGSTDKEMSLWINGVKQTETVIATLAAIDANVGDFVIGQYGTVGISFWDGLIDEAFVFNRALSDAEILGIYTDGIAGPASPEGSAVISGVGHVVAAGIKLAVGAAVLSAVATVAAAGIATMPGVAALSAHGTVAAAGGGVHSGSAILSAHGTVAGTGTKAASGSAALSAPGEIVATGNQGVVLGSQNSYGIGWEIGAYIYDAEGPSGSAVLSAVGTMAAAGTKQGSGIAAISTPAHVVATGTKATSSVSAISAPAEIVATGTKADSGSAVLSAPGHVVGAGTKADSGSAVLSTPGHVVAAGEKVALSSGGVLLANQNGWGAGWDIGAYVYVSDEQRRRGSQHRKRHSGQIRKKKK
jgi:hypothetical protein